MSVNSSFIHHINYSTSCFEGNLKSSIEEQKNVILLQTDDLLKTNPKCRNYNQLAPSNVAALKFHPSEPFQQGIYIHARN